MTPSHTNKAGKRYRYYVTPASEVQVGEVPSSIPAQDIELVVVGCVRKLLSDHHTLASLGLTGDVAAALQRAASAAQKLDVTTSRQSLIGLLVARVDMDEDTVAVQIDLPSLFRLLRMDPVQQHEPMILTTPALRLRHGKETKLVLMSNEAEAAQTDLALVSLLGEARSARDAVLSSPGQTIKQVAMEIGQCRSRLAKLVRLSWLAPEIIDVILDGRHPPRLTPRRLLDMEMQLDWADQKAALGIA